MPQTRHYEMKDSGVEWIGKMPSHWSASPFKKIIAQNDGGVWGEDPIDNDGAVVLRSTEQTVDGKWNIEQPAKRDLSHVAKLRYYKLEIGDLLITKSSGSALHIGKTSIVDADIAKLHCFYSNFMQRVRLKQNVMPKLYWYIMNSSIARYQFVFLQNSTSGIGNVNSKHIDNIIVPVPPLPEQAAIAAYLDEKCAAIDGIVTEAKASIEEYKSWKASVIFETVTKGLNPNAEMKDSGVEWIGEMPKDWDIVRFKRMHRGSNVGLSLDKDYWSTNEDDTVFYTAGLKSIHTSYKDIEPEMLTKENDLLLARNGTPYVYFPSIGAIYTDHIIRVGIENGYNKAFVRYCLQQSIANEVVDTVSIATWSVPIWNRQCLPHPSLTEQTAIAAYLDEKCAAIDGVILEKEELIRELENYKRSLIFEVVTGKRRVC